MKLLFFKFVKFSLFFALILIFFKAFIVPHFNKKSRDLLLEEGIGSFINLIKENNFNNPSRKTTIYVEEKNKIGELKNVVIFQEEEPGKNKVIIAKNGIVTKIKDENYFVTEKGIVQEMGPSGTISQITFDKTATDIKNFKKKSADYYKFNELSFSELLNKYLNDIGGQKLGALSELLNMFLAPLIIPSLLLLLSSLFLSREYKISKKLLKFYLFVIGFFLIFILEYLLSYSGKNILFGYIVTIYLTLIFILNLYATNKSFENAAI